MKKFLIFEVVLGLAIPVFSFLWPSECLKNQRVLDHYDAIIVLGNPANDDCSPGLMMMERLDKGIELYKRGIAKKMLLCGGKVSNSCIESVVMKYYSIQNGVNEEDIFIDTLSQNTYQNAYYSILIMRKIKFNSAAIVSSKFHTKRACGIFSRYNFDYTIFSCEENRKISKVDRFEWKIRESLILSYHCLFGYKTRIGLTDNQKPCE